MEFFLKHPHWQGVELVAQKLRENGYRAWLAGGCVRDLLLHRIATDFDVATDATPDQVEWLFDNSVSVGKAFGVIVVPFDGYQIEVSTFRKDGKYSDGRHPDQIEFSGPEEDAQRRDFTVNAMFYDIEKQQIIDFVDGQKDLKNRLLRCVGKPLDRFEEDQLRVLRAVRFAAQLAFDIESETWRAVRQKAADMHRVSQERIRDEWWKLLSSKHPARGLQLLDDSRLWTELFPFWKNLPEQSDSWFSLKLAIDNIPTEANISQRALVFLESISQNIWPDFAKKRDQELIDEVKKQAQLIVNNAFSSFKMPTRFIREAADTLMKKHLRNYLPQLRQGLQIQLWSEDLPLPWLDGEGMKKLGVAPGPLLGELLREAYLRQLEGRDKDRRAQENWLKSKMTPE